MVDGQSADNSLAIIELYRSKFAHVIIEEDGGQYEGVQKGFEKSTGEIMAWINSDDLYMPGAFHTVNEIFGSLTEVEWLMGFPGEISSIGTPFHRINLPWARWSKWRYCTFDFQFIQQESCFWKRTLWDASGASLNREYKLAADMELWARFFRHAKLYTTISGLAAFRQHSHEQRSRIYRKEYLAECQEVIKRERRRLPMGQRVFLGPRRLVNFLLWPFFFYEIPLLKRLYNWFSEIPPLINFNVDRGRHEFSEQVMKLPPIMILGKNITTDTFRKSK